ncbi:MAG: nicotinate-nucleotide adenylyltransferase [Cyclobacteriaceae bacterium]|nr:nicotinate-nucleotide adenylyltransferase [Cyclobacteriaceae bacterium]
MDSKKTIGLFFGSFNPIHVGHLIIANSMLENGPLDKVWFVVTPQNPLKPSRGLLHEFDRFDMVKAAITDNYKFEVSDVEFHLPKPSYTAYTLAHLSEKNPDKNFVLIIGEDNLANFGRWKNHEHILESYQLFVYPRPRVTNSDLKRHANVKMVDAPVLDISATFIRNQIKGNKSIKYLVPESVEHLIESRGFYL